MKTTILGTTRLGLPLFLHQWDQGAYHLLIIGGVHGDEIEGVTASRGVLAELVKNFPFKIKLSIIPELNPEGVLLKTRSNSAGVDLNRNLPTQDWTAEVLNPRYNPGPSALSEPENKILVQFLETEKPDAIISLHSWKPMLNVNGEVKQAAIIAQHTGYEIVPDIGYPTPGSLGTYSGLEKKIPTLTYEIERDLNLAEIIKVHVPAIIKAIDFSQSL